MKVYIAKELLGQLEQEVRQTLQTAQQLRSLSNERLNTQPQVGTWSIAQVLEHLNSYNRYYLPEIETALQKARLISVRRKETFSPGWFGNYFTKMMQPGKGGVISKKYSAPSDHVPASKQDVARVIDEFINGQERLIDFLQQSLLTNMGSIKVPISISRFIRLKLGDTFRFLIAHQQRHFIQIQAILNRLEQAAPVAVK